LTRPLLILTALRYEADALSRRLRAVEGADLRVVGPRCQGLSKVNAIEGYGGIIMAGLGGALDPTLNIGDIVVDRDSDLDIPAGPWRRGVIHTTDGVVATVADKQTLFAATGALVADMENAIARACAAGLGAAFLGIRAVSDAADDPLDPATLRWIDPAGALNPGPLLADLCRRPARIPALWRLGRRSRVAVGNLADAVERIVRARQDAVPRVRVASRSVG
jgi:adenosylhomocysteine nucleosidase